MCFPTSATKTRGPLEDSLAGNGAKHSRAAQRGTRANLFLLLIEGHYLGSRKFPWDARRTRVSTSKRERVRPLGLRLSPLYIATIRTEREPQLLKQRTRSLLATYLLFFSGKIFPSNWSQRLGFICWWSVLKKQHTHTAVLPLPWETLPSFPEALQTSQGLPDFFMLNSEMLHSPAPI